MSAFTERRRALQALGIGVAMAGAVMVTGSAGRRWQRRTSAREGCHEPALHVWEEVAVAHEKCSSRKGAVDAGRRLMAEKAEWVGPDMEISVNVRSALEWRPDDWE